MGDMIRTTSSSANPSSSAVAGLISTQLFHITVVVGSGISCSQGLLAPLPSPKIGDKKGSKKNSPEPSNLAAPVERGTLSARTPFGISSLGCASHHPPYCWNCDIKPLISAALKNPSWMTRLTSADCLYSTSSF